MLVYSKCIQLTWSYLQNSGYRIVEILFSASTFVKLILYFAQKR